MRVGVVPDLHLPFTHPRALDFVKDTFKAWNVDQIVFIGDVVDLHAVSFWDANPDGMSGEDESQLASEMLDEWYQTFPVAKVCIGNHDARHFRKAKKAGIPSRFIKDYKEVWGTPKWEWNFKHVIDQVTYEHGTNSSGKCAALNRAVNNRRSTVIGHTHTFAGIQWNTNEENAIFGLNVGCLIDIKRYAFEYGQFSPNRPVLGCGVVIDGHGYFERMAIGRKEDYHR